MSKLRNSVNCADWSLDGLDFEVQSDEREDETLEILHQVVEAPECVRVLAGVDVDEGSDLGRGEGDVLVSHHDLELLAADAIGLRPKGVVFVQDLRHETE